MADQQTAGLQQMQGMDSMFRATGQANADQWLGNRENYYADLETAYAGAAGQQADVAERDSTRTNSFRQAAKGTRGGSADIDAQGRIQTASNVTRQQGRMRGIGAGAQQKLADQQRIQRYLADLYGSTQGAQLALGGYTDSLGVNPQAQFNLWQQQETDRAQSNAAWSQIYGQQLSNVGQGISSYGSSR